MKKITLSIVLLLSGIAFAQIPTGYYNTATGTGYTLKTNLKKIINDQNDGLASEHISVDQGYSGLYTTYQTSDVKKQTELFGTCIQIVILFLAQ